MKKAIAAMLIVVGVLAPTAAMAAPYASNTDAGGAAYNSHASSAYKGLRGSSFVYEHRIVMSGGYYRFEPFW